jgi:hypothetical protein
MLVRSEALHRHHQHFVCVSELSTMTEAVSKQSECFGRGILRWAAQWPRCADCSHVQREGARIASLWSQPYLACPALIQWEHNGFFPPNYETYLSCCMNSLPDWRLPVVGSMVNVSSGSSLGSSMKMPESLQFICSPTSGNPLQRVSFVLSRFGPGQQGVAALPTVANPTNIHCITAKKH